MATLEHNIYQSGDDEEFERFSQFEEQISRSGRAREAEYAGGMATAVTAELPSESPTDELPTRLGHPYTGDIDFRDVRL